MVHKNIFFILLHALFISERVSFSLQNVHDEQLKRILSLLTFPFLKTQATVPMKKYDSVLSEVSHNIRMRHQEWASNVIELIREHGYPAETHQVTTRDGYILTLHRIPSGRNNHFNRKPVVVLMAGILCSSADWVVNGPGKALSYLLADEGYDVWVGNNRGTTWSRGHVTLNSDVDKEYWNFSFHEMGIYDLPAIIDHILELTQQPDLYYIAHSQGATSFFVMASEIPAYNIKIRLMSALAPVTYSNHVKSPIIKLLLPNLEELMHLADDLKINKILKHSPLIALIGRILCNNNAPTQDLCAYGMFLATGFDSPQLNKTVLPVLFSNFPAGASIKQIWHFAKEMRNNGKFQKFDYGPENNLNIYGHKTPPEYNLTKVTAPVVLYSSLNDWIASEIDIYRLVFVLPNVIRYHVVQNNMFNHLDYMWATDAKSLVYDHIMRDLHLFRKSFYMQPYK